MNPKRLKKDQLIRIVDVLANTLDRLQSLTANKICMEYKNKYHSAVHEKNGSFSFVPFTTRFAVAQIIKAYDVLRLDCGVDKPYRAYRFLDAGCGIGNIMLLAIKVGFSVNGLEIDPTIIRFAKEINMCHSGIIKQNILTYKQYDKYDVIYFYRPIRNGAKQAKFENCVRNQMKQGAILIPNLIADRSLETDTRFKKILVERFSYLYQKVAK